MSELSDKIYPDVDSFSHIRFAPSGDIAIVAPARGKKPKSYLGACIFCPDKLDELAEPSLKGSALVEMKRRGLYILDNAYPVVATEEMTRGIDLNFVQGFGGIFYDMNVATGRHLVMIETPNHSLNPFSETQETVNYYENLVWGYINMLKLLKSEGYKWGGVGKNRNGMKTFKVPLLHKLLRTFFPDYGVIDAGSSQGHPHSQALAMNFIPGNLEQNILSFKDYDLIIDGLNHLMLQGCPGCMEVRDNRHGDRKLYSDDIHYSFVAPVPKGQNPYHVEVRVMPLNHQSHFENMAPEEVASFIRVLHETMVLLGRKYPNMGYNFELRQGPWKTDYGAMDIRVPHWEFSIYPAWPKLDTEKHTGFIPHLLEAPVLKITPEQIGKGIKEYKIK